MKKKIKIIIGVFLVFMCAMNVYADEVCESSELTRLRKLAEKVDFSYDYEIKELTTPNGVVNKYLEYSINAINLNPELQVVVGNNYHTNNVPEFKGDNSGKATLNGFAEGEKVKITIYAYVANACSGKKITTKTINLPYRNKYHDSDECRTSTDYEYCRKDNTRNFCDLMQKFKYCQEFLDEPVTQEKFNSKLNEYLNSNPQTRYKITFVESNKYLIPMIVGGIVIIGIGIYLIIKRKKNKKTKIKISR